MPLIYFLPPLATVLIWSGNMTINQLSVGAIAPSSIAFLRWLLALVVMTPFVLPAVLRHKDEIVRNWPKLALLGLLGMGLWQGLAYVAAETTTATNMGILAAMVPLLTVLLSALILKEPPTLGGVMGGRTGVYRCHGVVGSRYPPLAIAVSGGSGRCAHGRGGHLLRPLWGHAQTLVNEPPSLGDALCSGLFCGAVPTAALLDGPHGRR